MTPLVLLPKPRKAFYTYGSDDNLKTVTYTVLWFAITDPPLDDNRVYNLYHTTYLLILTNQGKATYMGIDQLTFYQEEEEF